VGIEQHRELPPVSAETPEAHAMCAYQDAKKDRSRGKGSMLNMLRQKKEEKPRMITVREEKKTLVRVVKAKPKAVKHRADVLERKAVSEREMKITSDVVQRVTSPSGTVPANAPAASRQPRVRMFECPECGARIPEESEMCPVCHIKYLKDLCPEALAELDRAMSEATRELSDLIEIRDVDSLPVLHFDTLEGIMNFLEEDDSDSEFVLECPHCSAAVQLDVEKCPICGTALESGDVGILSLLRGTDFDSCEMSELECPQCGEHVRLVKGTCPVCDSLIVDPEGSGDEKKLVPIVGTDNIVFVHIDLEKGDLNYVQKHLSKVALDHISIQLEQIGSGGFDQEWKGLSRI
jgi:rubrerythrin